MLLPPVKRARSMPMPKMELLVMPVPKVLGTLVAMQEQAKAELNQVTGLTAAMLTMLAIKLVPPTLIRSRVPMEAKAK